MNHIVVDICLGISILVGSHQQPFAVRCRQYAINQREGSVVLGQGECCQGGDRSKGGIADARNACRNTDAGQLSLGKGLRADGGHIGGDNQFASQLTLLESALADGGQGLRQCDARQRGVVERSRADAGHIVAHRYRRQCLAVIEGANIDGGDGLRNVDAREACAAGESTATDGGNLVTLGKNNLSQCGAALEHRARQTGLVAGNSNLLQTTHAVERLLVVRILGGIHMTADVQLFERAQCQSCLG